MADTITILDGLVHTQQQTTASLYDIDSATISAVGTFPIAMPFSASQARVIFNNQFDPNGSTVACRVRLSEVTSITVPTKIETVQALEWTDLAQAGVLETGTIDLSADFDSTLHIDCCLSSTTAHTGTEIIVQIASEAAVDDAWTTLRAFLGPIGTAISAAMPAEEASGQTVIGLTNPVTNNFDNDGKFKFFKNGTIANSEIVYQVSNSGD